MTSHGVQLAQVLCQLLLKGPAALNAQQTAGIGKAEALQLWSNSSVLQKHSKVGIVAVTGKACALQAHGLCCWSLGDKTHTDDSQLSFWLQCAAQMRKKKASLSLHDCDGTDAAVLMLIKIHTIGSIATPLQQGSNAMTGSFQTSTSCVSCKYGTIGLSVTS